ncbi:MAG: peroxide stress protein YaaA [Asticcacaulis sp.]
MLTLISPAKSLDLTPFDGGLDPVEPRFQAQTAKLLKSVKRLKPKAIGALMGISENLSQLNYDRYQGFEDQMAGACIFMFDGDVYKGLEARTLETDSLAFAQDRLRILSGLYGVLRPLDLIHPYRLEMGSHLKTGRTEGLYQFWGETIAKSLMEDLRAQEGDTVINLASQEYARAALTKSMKATVITPRFLETKGNEAKIVSFFAKKARGLMARYIIDHRLDKCEGLKDFNSEGYRFRADLSKGHDWVFTRPQPAAKT